MKWLPPRPRPEGPEYPFAGCLEYQGLVVDVETKKGQYRSGTDDAGTPWRVKMPAHYGEVRGTEGADGDPVDVFIGPDPYAVSVWVIAIPHPGTKRFDETKAMVGFATRAGAMRTFRAAYNCAMPALRVTRWRIGAWREALTRPHLARSQMGRPLTKAIVTRD